MPRACSDCFIRIPGTLAMPPPGKSAGRLNMISMVWLAGSAWSVLRRSDQVTVMWRSGISMSARTASSGASPGPGETVSVRQIDGADITLALRIVRVLLVKHDALRHRRLPAGCLGVPAPAAGGLSGALLLRHAAGEFRLRRRCRDWSGSAALAPIWAT